MVEREVWVIFKDDKPVSVSEKSPTLVADYRVSARRYIPAESAKAEAQPAGTGWVSVEERLPEPGDWCWVIWKWHLQEQPWEWREDFSGAYWRHDDASLRVREGVTHWMPIAPPPPPERDR